jgi:hypothetical protein
MCAGVDPLILDLLSRILSDGGGLERPSDTHSKIPEGGKEGGEKRGAAGELPSWLPQVCFVCVLCDYDLFVYVSMCASSIHKKQKCS